MSSYKTSLYVSKVELPIFPTRASVRKGVWESLKEIKLSENVQESIKFIEKTQNVIFNDTIIAFSVREIPEEKYYLVSFFPYGENTSIWTKRDNIKAMNDVINFCDVLGNELDVIVEEGILHFNRQYLDSKHVIDISDWDVSFSSINPPEKRDLKSVLEELRRSGYNYVIEKVPKGKNFQIFTQTYLRDRGPIELLKQFLRRFGKVEGPKSLITARELGEKIYDKENTIFIFVENEKMLEAWYKNLKIFFDSNRIATQYVMDRTIYEKIKLPGIQANFILEVMTKLGLKPIQLRPPENIIDSDGFLCLSSIESTTRRLFGALFTYAKEGLEIEEEVQIYQDVEFSIHEGTLEIPAKDIGLLSEKISKLIGKG
ncbi:hypothetical protein KEJ24_00050 [Candidatus Bathyarchaeota archaeon]|nr:hypothetical protein [Candidatus Bathyarchaeota archaeon]